MSQAIVKQDSLFIQLLGPVQIVRGPIAGAVLNHLEV